MDKQYKISNSDLYLMTARSFAGYLGYPSFRKYLHMSTYFFANLTENEIQECHLSQFLRSIFNDSQIKDYDAFAKKLTKYWIYQKNDENIASFLDRDNLMEFQSLGESFVSIDFSCGSKTNIYRKKLAVQLFKQEEDVVAIFLIIDITDLYAQTTDMRKRADFDSLTDIYNRHATERLVTSYLKEYPNEPCALFILDVDNFKTFNDRYGHKVGDAALVSASNALKGFFARESIIGRNGGDEFIVLLKGRKPAVAEEEINRFINEDHSFEFEGNTYNCTFSIGFSTYPEQATNYASLVECADNAMYYVKMHQRATVAKFDVGMLSQKRTMLGFNLGEILEGIPGAIVVCKADDKQEILFGSEYLFNLFECGSMDDLLEFCDDSFFNLIHECDRERIMARFAKKEEKVRYGEFNIITKTGKKKSMRGLRRLVHHPKYGDIYYLNMIDNDEIIE